MKKVFRVKCRIFWLWFAIIHLHLHTWEVSIPSRKFPLWGRPVHPIVNRVTGHWWIPKYQWLDDVKTTIFQDSYILDMKKFHCRWLPQMFVKWFRLQVITQMVDHDCHVIQPCFTMYDPMKIVVIWPTANGWSYPDCCHEIQTRGCHMAYPDGDHLTQLNRDHIIQTFGCHVICPNGNHMISQMLITWSIKLVVMWTNLGCCHLIQHRWFPRHLTQIIVMRLWANHTICPLQSIHCWQSDFWLATVLPWKLWLCLFFYYLYSD